MKAEYLYQIHAYEGDDFQLKENWEDWIDLDVSEFSAEIRKNAFTQIFLHLKNEVSLNRIFNCYNKDINILKVRIIQDRSKFFSLDVK